MDWLSVPERGQMKVSDFAVEISKIEGKKKQVNDE
jgi:hypothetical protein